MGATKGLEKGLGWRARRFYYYKTNPSARPLKKWLEVVHVRISLGFRV